jgi:hypothetical protein
VIHFVNGPGDARQQRTTLRAERGNFEALTWLRADRRNHRWIGAHVTCGVVVTTDNSQLDWFVDVLDKHRTRETSTGAQSARIARNYGVAIRD